MAVFLSPVGGVAAQFFTNSGVILSGGKLYSYTAGTTTPEITYTSSGGSTAHTNPIILNSAGRVPSSGEIWLTDGISYKFVLTDANDVLIATYDNIVGINSTFTNFLANQEIQTATAGQTVFTLANPYVPGANTLSVFVDGVNQYGPSATYAYVETNSNTVTFTSGLHVGASVKFTTVQSLTSTQATTAALVSYTPGGTGAVTTNVQTKLRETVSVKDFGATGDGTTNDTSALQTAINYASTNGLTLLVPEGTYITTTVLTLPTTGSNIVGDVSQPRIKRTGADTTPVFQVAQANVGGGGTFENLYIDGNNIATEGFNLGRITGANNGYTSFGTKIINCNVFRCTSTGINTGSFATNAAVDVVIDKCDVRENGIGISIQQPLASIISTKFASNTKGLAIGGNGRVSVVNSIFNENNAQIFISNLSPCGNFTGCWFENSNKQTVTFANPGNSSNDLNGNLLFDSCWFFESTNTLLDFAPVNLGSILLNNCSIANSSNGTITIIGTPLTIINMRDMSGNYNVSGANKSGLILIDSGKVTVGLASQMSSDLDRGIYTLFNVTNTQVAPSSPSKKAALIAVQDVSTNPATKYKAQLVVRFGNGEQVVLATQPTEANL
jgi:hypothetical protein